MNTTDLLDVEYLDVAPEAFPAPREKAAGMMQLLPPAGGRAGGGWIAQRRAECWSRARDQLETTGHQLATITELVHLLHQESLAPSCSASLSAEVDSVLADFEHGEGAERELAGLGLDDTDTFLVQAIAAGPAALARRDRGADRASRTRAPTAASSPPQL